MKSSAMDRKIKTTAVLTLNRLKLKYKLWRAFFVALAFSAGFYAMNGVAFTPTPEQIQQLQNLSPAEQRKLAKAMGVELPAPGQKIVMPVQAPETVKPRELSQEPRFNNQDNFSRKPVFSENDDELEEETDSDSRQASDTDVDLGPQPFGYQLFAGSPTTFAPATDIPVPVNYSIGPGDSIIVQLYGKVNSINELVVSREGEIQFPEIGPISVNGLDFGELQKRIDQLVQEQMIGVKASVTMGALRSIRVFVLGEAYQPGSYTVSALSTMTNALFVSGGIEHIGSLRNITLKRNGKTVSELDLYDLLLRGDTSQDVRLMPGDVLFIPTVKKTVTVTGGVRRPAIYEIKNETNMAEIVALAGGYTAEAYPAAARVARVNAKGDRTVADINLKNPQGQATPVRDGDVLEIPVVLEKLENIVTLSGHVHREGHFNWASGLRVKDVVPSIEALKANPDLTIALLKREKGETRTVEYLTFNLGAAIRGDAYFNLQLQPRDEIIVFSAGAVDRVEQLKAQVDLIKEQHFGDSEPQLISLRGEVKSPGVYPLAQNMTISDALQLSGYLTTQGARQSLVLARLDPLTSAYEFQKIRVGSQEMRQHLKPRDEILVFSKIEARANLLKPLLEKIERNSRYGVPAPIVTVVGAVRFPGTYPLTQGADVEALLSLAGGLKEDAYRVSGELSRVSSHETGARPTVTHQAIAFDTDEGLATRVNSRDRLVVKSVPEWGESIDVTLKGEVRFPGVYPVENGETIRELIQRAGGLTEQADPKGAIFLRESLRQKEQAMLARFKKQLEAEASAVAAKKADEAGGLIEIESLKESLVSQIQEAQATGRLVFDLPGILKENSKSVDVVLKKGDSITIPPLIQEVSILGEVNFPTSHLYEKGLNAGQYLKKSGGTTRKADEKQAYVISRDGSVRPMYKWKFLWLGMKRKLEQGDTLVVPTDIDRMHPLTVWQKTSQILFQLATTAAALQTVGAI